MIRNGAVNISAMSLAEAGKAEQKTIVKSKT